MRSGGRCEGDLSLKRAVFLDRDGVVNRTLWNPVEQIYDSPYRIEDFELLPKAAAAIRRLNEFGYLAVVVSNQPGIAKGKCNSDFLRSLTEIMHEQLAAESARLDAVYYCLHHPEAVVPEYRSVCGCRKPQAGLLLQAAQDLDIDIAASCMIGDQSRDIEAGQAAGCSTILISDRPSAGQPTASSLYEAVIMATCRE
jgi:D-glycero-D-manno-heptose 1,7-bisphosphate phosphatase